MTPKMTAQKVSVVKTTKHVTRRRNRTTAGITTPVLSGTRFSQVNLNECDSSEKKQDDILTKNFIDAVRIANEVKLIKGLPISKYDKHLKKAFIEYPDGKKVYV